MDEVWLKTIITLYLKYEKKDDVLLKVIKPTIETLKRGNLIETFHFLFEPNWEIWFRVRLKNENNIEKIKQIIKENLKKMSDIIKGSKFNDPADQKSFEKVFGEDGWKIVQKFFEYNSRISLAKIDETVKKGEQFNDMALVHYFLNTLGYGVIGEAYFHLDKSIERLEIGSRFIEADKMLEIIKEIKENAIPKMEEWLNKKEVEIKKTLS